ncbi:MAG: hypothetical protein Q9202_004335 [Teloschistes flavicans]
MSGADEAVELIDRELKQGNEVIANPGSSLDHASYQNTLPVSSVGHSSILTQAKTTRDHEFFCRICIRHHENAYLSLDFLQNARFAVSEQFHLLEPTPSAGQATNRNESDADHDATQDGNHDETPQTPAMFFALPLEIRHAIYHLSIPCHKRDRVIAHEAAVRSARALPGPVEKKPNNRAWLDWHNLPSQAMALFRANKQFHHDCCNFTYGQVPTMKISVTPSETKFFGAILPTALFLPFPISTNWNWIKHWDIDLGFSKFNSFMRTSWGYSYNYADGGAIAHKDYNRKDQKAFYEYKHIEEGFVGVLHEMNKVSGLRSLTVRLPCVCCCQRNEGHFMRDRYMLLLRSHLTAISDRPSDSLNIILARIGSKDVPCPKEDCAYFSSAVSRMLSQWPRPELAPALPSRLPAVLLGWTDVKERATLLPFGCRGGGELRTALFLTWYILGWGRQSDEEKKKMVRLLREALDAELAAGLVGCGGWIHWYLHNVQGQYQHGKLEYPAAACDFFCQSRRWGGWGD